MPHGMEAVDGLTIQVVKFRFFVEHGFSALLYHLMHLLNHLPKRVSAHTSASIHPRFIFLDVNLELVEVNLYVHDTRFDSVNVQAITF